MKKSAKQPAVFRARADPHASTLGARANPDASTKQAPDPQAAQLRAIYKVVRSIPRGKVATYGQIAELAGIHAGHRVAARAMRNCPERLPWQRVVGKKDARRAQVNIFDPEHAALQRSLLRAEGVAFDAQGFIVLRLFGWLPR